MKPRLSSQVSSRGLVLAAGTMNSSSFSLTPTLSWSPEAWVTVYCVRADGELISDTAHVPTGQPNQVLCLFRLCCVSQRRRDGTVGCFQASLEWSSEKAHPGEQVWLTVKAAGARFQVGAVVMGTHGDAPKAPLSVRAKQVWRAS